MLSPFQKKLLVLKMPVLIVEYSFSYSRLENVDDCDFPVFDTTPSMLQSQICPNSPASPLYATYLLEDAMAYLSIKFHRLPMQYKLFSSSMIVMAISSAGTCTYVHTINVCHC